jgi:hypothetical protein
VHPGAPADFGLVCSFRHFISSCNFLL